MKRIACRNRGLAAVAPAAGKPTFTAAAAVLEHRCQLLPLQRWRRMCNQHQLRLPRGAKRRDSPFPASSATPAEAEVGLLIFGCPMVVFKVLHHHACMPSRSPTRRGRGLGNVKHILVTKLGNSGKLFRTCRRLNPSVRGNSRRLQLSVKYSGVFLNGTGDSSSIRPEAILILKSLLRFAKT